MIVDDVTTDWASRGGGVGDQPLFLLGPSRSGTSLLYKLMCLHPDAGYISNYVARAPALSQLAVMNRLARRFPARQRQIWFGADGANAYVYGERRRLVDRLFPMPVEGEPVFRRAGVPEVALPVPAERPQLAARLRRSVEGIRRAGGGRVFVNKRIANIYRVPLLADAWPRGRFVCLVRDGRAVALSLSKVDWWPTSTVVGSGVTPQRWAADGGDPWELCARNWRDEIAAMETGMSLIPRDLALWVRYEDLIAAPEETLSSVAKFAGLDPRDPKWRRAIAEVSFPDRNETWREKLTSEAVATISRIQAPTLERYHYGR